MQRYVFNRQALKADAKTKINIKSSMILVLILYFIPTIISSYGLFTTSSTVSIDGMFYEVLTPNFFYILFVTVIPFILEYWSSAYYLHVGSTTQSDTNSVEFFKTLKFKGFINYMLKIIVMNLFIFLWTLLFIVPGIIKIYSYLMVPYIAVEHPEYSVFETLRESSRIMKGYKMDMLVTNLSFLGWAILNSMTFGIIGFWVMPYMNLTSVNVYLALTRDEQRVVDSFETELN